MDTGVYRPTGLLEGEQCLGRIWYVVPLAVRWSIVLRILLLCYVLDAVQFSLLAGRLFVKEFRYHSTNQSIRVVKCHITWRYWFWRTRGETEMGHIRFTGEDVNSKPTRL